MKLILNKLFPILLLSFSACDDCNYYGNCPPETCDVITIETADYFKTDRTLTNHCTIGDGVDYIIESETIHGYYDVTATLNVEKGTKVVFRNGAGLAIKGTGSISAIGTTDEPITFRGTSENAVGSWRGIYIETNQAANVLNYLTIKGAGGDSFNSNDDKGNIVVYADASVRIDNCTISNSASYGVNANYETCKISSFRENKLNNNNIPILMFGNNVDIVDASNSFLGNSNSYVHTRVSVGNHEINTAKIWQALSIPYRITASDGGIFKHQEVGSNGSLTINAGAVVEFEAETGFDIDDTAAFSAEGTANSIIIFKGVTPVAGFWDGIKFQFTQNSNNKIVHATIQHAGSDKGVIYMWADPFILLQDVKFNDIANCAVYDAPKYPQDANNPNLTTTNVIYTNVGNQYCRGN